MISLTLTVICFPREIKSFKESATKTSLLKFNSSKTPRAPTASKSKTISPIAIPTLLVFAFAENTPKGKL